MSWFLRGVQSAVFHYASCAPCTGYADARKRRREAKLARKAREKLVLEQPGAYHHPEPTGTNPYWHEEIALGPGPPPRRARRTNTGSTKVGLPSTQTSQNGSSLDGDGAKPARLSDDTMDDDTWNLKRYQREDEHLWGLDEAPMPAVHHTPSASSSSGLGSMMLGYKMSRPTTSRSGSYYSARAPPVNDLHPPVVSLPSHDVADNRWMLQPPPKASVMAGKERATHRSRSGSGASSRVELSLQRQVSTRQLMHRLDRGQTQDLPPMDPHGSYTDLLSTQQRRNRSRTPQARPPSVTSSRKRRDTAVALNRTDTLESQNSVTTGRTTPTTSRTVSVRQNNRPVLSTVVSSGSGASPSPSPSPPIPHSPDENASPERREQAHHRDPTRSSDSLSGRHTLPRRQRERAPLSSSDLSSLNCLQDTVSPRALLNSRFVSAPLVEAKIRLPPSNGDLANSARHDEQPLRAPFDSQGVVERDPTLRWSVDF